MRKSVDLGLATRLINHGPVVLVTSMYDEKVNVTPVAWHMPVQKKPPMIALEIGENHFIFECIMKTRDFVVNIPPSSMVEDIVRCGSASGRDTDKLKLCGLSSLPSKEIKSPSLSGAIAVLECVLLRDEHLLSEYNIVLGEVKYAEAEEDAFDEHWLFEPGKMKTVHHLGNKTFCVPGDGFIDLRGQG